MDRPFLLTTSWDDGDPADLRLAETVALYDLRATFYLCRDRQSRPRLTEAQIGELAAIPGMEIGSHTLTHPNLRRLSSRQVDAELIGSKSWLEDLIGRPVTSFCYPSGLHRRSLARRVAAAGYSVGRTTMSGHTGLSFDPLLMPTTVQLYPHKRLTQLRHALKERDADGFRNLLSVRSWSRRPVELARRFLEQASTMTHQPAAIHLWGHSWELDHAELWSALQDLLGYVRDAGSVPKTNQELAQSAQMATESRAGWL